mgnify:CR=1 FL=1
MPEEPLSACETAASRASNGDTDAFQRLVHAFQDDIYRLVFFRIQSEMDAQDLTQEIFVTAMKKIDSLKSPGLFRSWIYRIAVNKVRDHIRKKKLLGLFSPFPADEGQALSDGRSHDDGSENQEERLYRKEFWQNVHKLTASLSAMEKEVFMLRFFDQRELTEIAVILKRKESTVKTHLYRALGKIKANPEKNLLLEGIYA